MLAFALHPILAASVYETLHQFVSAYKVHPILVNFTAALIPVSVASAMHPVLGRHIRVEHWANALNQPQAAARAMLGQDVAYDKVPYFYTDQYDLGMEYAGYVEPGGYDQVVFRGDVDRREFVAFWLGGGRVLAGMNVNVWDVNDAIQTLVNDGRPVDPARLADAAVPLDEVAGG